MQQAPEYREQDQVRRDYVPQQPAPAQQGRSVTDPAVSGRSAGPTSWSDWVRWGPVWSGFFAILATLIVLGSLGTAIGLSVWGATPNRGFGYGWAIFTGIVAYFLGGWVTARSAGVRGVAPALLNSALAWALSLAAVLVLVVIGASGIIGAFGSNLALLVRTPGSGGAPANTAGNIATTAWVTFAALVIGLILAMIGGLLGSHALPERGRRARAM